MNYPVDWESKNAIDKAWGFHYPLAIIHTQDFSSMDGVSNYISLETWKTTRSIKDALDMRKRMMGYSANHFQEFSIRIGGNDGYALLVPGIQIYDTVFILF